MQGWATPGEDEAALKARLETLNGLAQAMVDKSRHEEAAAYHARVLKLTQKAVHGKVGALKTNQYRCLGKSSCVFFSSLPCLVSVLVSCSNPSSHFTSSPISLVPV